MALMNVTILLFNAKSLTLLPSSFGITTFPSLSLLLVDWSGILSTVLTADHFMNFIPTLVLDDTYQPDGDVQLFLSNNL